MRASSAASGRIQVRNSGFGSMRPIKTALGAALFMILSAGVATACPKGQARDSFGICWPKCGGALCEGAEHVKEEAAKVAEKMAKEAANAERDVRVWIETGKCGGDVCDALGAAVHFTTDQVSDIGPSLERAAQRLSEGKPLDAVWHLGTDQLRNANENATVALQRSTLLGAVAQVAASAYGGPWGAAAYSAWLTYNLTDGDVGSALKAGIISGATAFALKDIQEIKLDSSEQIARAAVLTAAVNGAAVAAAGGSQEDVRRAAEAGVATVLIRSGYLKLTKVNLDEKRLRSSQGPAYCKEALPDSGLACVPPRDAYRFNAEGQPLAKDLKTVASADNPPYIDETKLIRERAHVGMWSDGTSPKHFKINDPAIIGIEEYCDTLVGLDERSCFMTGISKIPLANAMAVGHDAFDSAFIDREMMIDIIPRVGTIPPAITLTYVGSGQYIHDMIREGVGRENHKAENDALNDMASYTSTPARPIQNAEIFEQMNVVCGRGNSGLTAINPSAYVSILAAPEGRTLRSSTSRICEVTQVVDGIPYTFWHAHHKTDSCFLKATEVVRRHQLRGFDCFADQGVQIRAGGVH